MADSTRRTALRTAVVLEVLADALARTAAGAPPSGHEGPGGPGGRAGAGVERPGGRDGAAGVKEPGGCDGAGLDVLDVGGGSGGFAVPLAALGHRVTVIDPSPDSLAALGRRAAEAGVGDSIRGVQGDLGDLPGQVAPGGYAMVLCHSVLEVVEDPAIAMAALARVVRPGGTVSVLAANRTAAVLTRVLAGHVEEAARLLADPDGRAGPADPLARRFTLPGLLALVAAAGLRVGPVHGVRIFTDLVPGGLLDSEPAAAQVLLELERTAADRPDFRELAAALHVLALRDPHPDLDPDRHPDPDPDPRHPTTGSARRPDATPDRD